MRKSPKSSLTPSDWAKAAYRSIARGGVDAISVEAIAVELGATKGSFYWHFKNRDALIEAALDEWEHRLTDRVIERLELDPDPAQRLRKLLNGAFQQRAFDRAAEVALLANPEHPLVRRRVRQVARRRMEYIAEQLESIGWQPAEASDRAVILSCLYVGYLQTAHVAPSVMGNEARRRHAEIAFDSLIVADLVPDRPKGPELARSAGTPPLPT